MVAKVAINSGAYVTGTFEKKPVPIITLAKEAGEIGYKGIEIAPAKAHVHPDTHPTKDSRKNIVSIVNNHGMKIIGYGADMEQCPPAVSEVSDYLREFEKYLRVCMDLGAKWIRIDTVLQPPLPVGVSYDEAWLRVVSAWKRASRLALVEDVTLLWEFEPGFMFNKPSEAVKMVEDVGQPNFKIMFDTCHAQMCAVNAARQAEPEEKLEGGVVELAQKLKGKISRVHLIDSDNTLHNEKTSTHAAFGAGVLDFDQIMPALLEAEYDPEWWCVDLCFHPEARELMENSFKFVSKLLAKHVKE